ncbi:MAG TPA: DUF4349 domain-containing protein [Acidimicrobiales bacterium]|nr:DUF4349 domain-containing protein [Acidimicrobiales bacterium]
MLDDLTLERLIGDAAEEIVVPAEGPGRVIAAREALGPARRGLSERGPNRFSATVAAARRRPLRLAALVVASVSVVGVAAAVANSGGGGPEASSKASRSLGANGGAVTFGPEAGTAGGGAGTQGSTGAAAAQSSAGTSTQPVPNLVPGSAQAKVIKTGSMTLRVGSVESTVSRLEQLAAGAGGYIAANSTNIPGGPATASADITVRVPGSAFETFASQVEALGTPSQISMSGQDVTSEYSDLKARLQALQSTINQLELIETRAQTIGDILAVEQQISSQQSQADQIQGQINVLNDQTSYGSLSVHLLGPEKKAAVVPPPPSGISKAWDHARHSFAAGVEAVIGALGGIAVFLLFAGILLGLASVGWTALRRRLV